MTGVDGTILAEWRCRAYIVAIAPSRNAWHAYLAQRILRPHSNRRRERRVSDDRRHL
ncbi:protein of unknown function [Methylorubrum extorquens]|uniref:Uncharacterized protein n=1 Tax=Methylorubrum extorquens TaxID=408 RepID=A0A2N9AS85_METEX|nr:protein of unknown function [Methylorubrum extorquens]